eukprot:TRINITY_DN774111_c0_g1_i1.p1 TRINITY_DN774111_c0_g1~~TRINITY_DN774111_c0_g1_i1.p1  ORF type:complete len:582 (+),score=125.00 TRINITY_DN774111_c0_g1_i1:159-1904(+)
MASEEQLTAYKNDPWLNAWFDPVANLNAYSGCMRYVDLNGDGDEKLLVADSSSRLRVYKGTAMSNEVVLVGKPSVMCHFYSDSNMPRIPAVAVGSGNFVYIYRNLKPYFRFTLPNVEPHAKESHIWDQIALGSMNAEQGCELLQNARDDGIELSNRSMDLLAKIDIEEQKEFIDSHKNAPNVQPTCITCMESIKRESDVHDAVSSLVIGTENKYILFLDPAGASIEAKVELPGVPVMLDVNGLYSMDYRLTVACRNGRVYSIRRNELVRSSVIEMETQIVGLCRVDRNIIIATTDQKIHSFHTKGKKNFSITMPAPIIEIAPLKLRSTRTVDGLLITLGNGELRIYQDKQLVSCIQQHDNVMGIRVGTFGREEGTVSMVMSGGALSIKMLKRKAKLEAGTVLDGPPPEQNVKLPVPKKTKLYVEQTQRERDQATEMHRIFQRDLCKIRLQTARAYVKIITEGHVPMLSTQGAAIKLTAQVQGLGPQFKLALTVHNAGTSPLTDLPITFGYNHDLYAFPKSIVRVPILVPSVVYTFEVPVVCVDPAGGSDMVKIYVCHKSRPTPVLTAIVNMPMCNMIDPAE